MNFNIDGYVTVKNDGLTRDCSEDELRTLLSEQLKLALTNIPWIIDYEINLRKAGK